jgi:outer membrane murein-binding lipoprotein Lpp
LTRAAAVALTAALAAALALTGCHSGGARKHDAVETRFLDKLSGAIGALNAARARLATDAAAIGAAAARIDDVDDVAVDGDRNAVRARRALSAKVVPTASVVARRYGKDVTADQTAVTALSEATGVGLDDEQRAAVDAVATAASREVDELHSYATVLAAVWPRYEQLNGNQKLWLERASNGWYRDQHESAGAYVALTDRAGLDAARRNLAAADRRRLAAARTVDRAVAAARTALASLLG